MSKGCDTYYMTVCLASLYENGRGAVLVADRMTTHKREGMSDLHVEREDTIKIFKITPTVAVLISGDAIHGQMLVEAIEKKTRPNYRIDTVLTKIKEVTDRLVEEHGVREYLFPMFHDARDFREATNIPASSRQSYEKVLRDYVHEFGVNVIVVGKNRKGIYELWSSEHGFPYQLTKGFHTIGSGAKYAKERVETSLKQSMTQQEIETLLRDAKKDAEQDDEVGKTMIAVEYLE